MSWLANPAWQGVGSITGIFALVVAIISIPIFWRHKQQKNHANDVCSRFVFLFRAHGIERTQIPRFLGEEFGLTLADISTDEKLIIVLKDNILKAACERFGVRRGWLEGDMARIYDPCVFYKDIAAFMDFINVMKERHPDEFCYLQAFKPSNTSSDLFKSQPDISLVFAEPIAEIDQKTIYRYYPIWGPLPWDHSPARFNLYAFFTLAFMTHRILLRGYEAPVKLLSKIAGGEIIPTTVKRKGLWHPDDYAFSDRRDMPVKSPEISAFWDYVTENGWLELFDKNIISRPEGDH